ncbi:MAG: VOC family protein [Acholeplasma sp.]|nr:VOC family protein [Acholeplasma sp.]
MKIYGIHHISGIVKHPQENIDFYTSVLGLKFIKKAVNFDDAGTYHFYFGNNDAEVGSVITFFPWNSMAKEGVIGGGILATTTYAIPLNSISFWEERLTNFKVPFEREFRFNQVYLAFEDMHGIRNELVETNIGKENDFEYNGITKDYAIKGFYGGILYSTNYYETKKFLEEIFEFKLYKEDDEYIRYELDSDLGRYLDLLKKDVKRGRLSTGTNHHIAFSVDDVDAWRDYLISKSINVSEVKDRDFFKSIYFKEPGGTVFELATREPGFSYLSDFDLNKIYLPEKFESSRAIIEERLIPVFVEPVLELVEYPYYNKDTFTSYFYHKNLLKKINMYARLSKERKLTDEEIQDRDDIRQKYVENITRGILSAMDGVLYENEDGDVEPFFKIKKGVEQ